MDRFFEITNVDSVRGNSNLNVEGIPANVEEWKKHSFYPKRGVVGVLIGEGYIREGSIYVLNCGGGNVVPVLPSGVREITRTSFMSKYSNNSSIGYATETEINEYKNKDIMNSLMSQFGL